MASPASRPARSPNLSAMQPDDLAQSLASQLLAVGDHSRGVGLVRCGVGHFLDGGCTAEDRRVAPDERGEGLAPRPGRDDVGEERLLRRDQPVGPSTA